MYKYEITDSIQNKLDAIKKLIKEITFIRFNSFQHEELDKFAKIKSIHFSTKIEDNRLHIFEVNEIVETGGSRTKFVKDIIEVKGYEKAFNQMMALVESEKLINELDLCNLHALVLTRVVKKEVKYRDGQNAIYSDGSIIYMPPEAKDVPLLMKKLIEWINELVDSVPIPIIAGMAHYAFATIHPFMDGNGRTARLLTNWILYRYMNFEYQYSLEEYYFNNLQEYYSVLKTSQKHNYYDGRENADVTSWLDFFLSGMIDAFEILFRDKFGRLSHDIEMSLEEFKENIDDIFKSEFIEDIAIEHEVDGRKLTFILSNHSKAFDNEELWQNLRDSNFCYDYLKGERIISKYGAGLYQTQNFDFDFYKNMQKYLK